jgi:enamine deaminase RidA (YjgF/YER057c/UK114 family)
MEKGTFPAGIAAQMEQAIKNIGEVLAAADCRLDDVVKVTTYITPEAYAWTRKPFWPRRSTRAHSLQSRSLRDRHRGWLYLFRRP